MGVHDQHARWVVLSVSGEIPTRRTQAGPGKGSQSRPAPPLELASRIASALNGDRRVPCCAVHSQRVYPQFPPMKPGSAYSPPTPRNIEAEARQMISQPSEIPPRIVNAAGNPNVWAATPPSTGLSAPPSPCAAITAP